MIDLKCVTMKIVTYIANVSGGNIHVLTMV